ncbi:MAG: redoxin family protein [Candidatus Paceibacterota bacterium]
MGENPFSFKVKYWFKQSDDRRLQEKSFWGDVIVGAALGPVFSTCSPTYFLVLAAVLPETPIIGLIYLVAYSVGLSISLLIISFLGQKLLNKVGVAADPRGTFKKVLGIIFLIVGIGIITGADKDLQVKILDSGFFDVTKIEQKLLEKVNTKENVQTDEMTQEEDLSASEEVNAQEEVSTKIDKKESGKYLTPAQKSVKFSKVPELVNPNGYINTNGEEIKLKDYIGKKVVLVDFWTYSCINCKRTTPYLNAWYKEYEDDGLVIVGVHTPEFAFEKLQKNVEKAMEEEGIKYPVVLDNDYATWNAFNNRYWPRKYLVDVDGYIVYDHIGEGAYDETEKEIQKALAELSFRLGKNISIPNNISQPENVITVDGAVKSPEIYFGSERNKDLANGESFKIGIQDFSLPKNIDKNKLYLSGKWNIKKEYAESEDLGSVVFRYDAKNVYMVLSSDLGSEIDIFLDNVFVKTMRVEDETLYDLISGQKYV